MSKNNSFSNSGDYQLVKSLLKLEVLWIGFLMCIVSPRAIASEHAPRAKNIASNVWHDQRAIATSPLRMDMKDKWLWGTTGVSLLALMPTYNSRQSLDERLLRGIERENQTYGTFFKRLTYLGDGRVLFGASLTTYGISALGDYEGAQRFSANWTEALIDTALWATAIKILAGRNRPQNGEPDSEFHGPVGYFRNQGVNSSFPSGHTAMAFATAAVFTRESDNNPWVGVPAYLVAGGVGFSRMYVEKHWLSDILFGAVLGHSIGTLVENRHHRSGKTAFRFEPVLNAEEPGIALVCQW